MYGTLKNGGNLHAGDTNQVIVRIDPRNVPDKGDTISVTIKPDQTHAFSASTGERLG